MKKLLLSLIVLIGSSALTFAQSYGFVDSEYVSSNIPEYTAAQSQLKQLAEQYEQEISVIYNDVEDMYEQYQKEVASLSQSQRVDRQSKMIAKEQEIQELQTKYYGADGEYIKKQNELISPIQKKILNAIKEVAIEGNFIAIFDSSSSDNLLYANPAYDVSDKVLAKLGINN